MRSRIFVGMLLLVSVLAAGIMATSSDRIAPSRQSAIAYLAEPTWIGSTMVQGSVRFTHDDAKMARGEACTTVQLIQGVVGLDSTNGSALTIAQFHCIPEPHAVVSVFTLTTRPNVGKGFGCVLTAYQFAGDPEIHGVPAPADGQ